MSKHYLFVYPAPGVLGGIETLLARMSRWLLNNGDKVTLLVERGENWTDTLPAGVKCVVLGKRFSKLYYYFHAKKLWKSLGIPAPDVVKSFDLPSSWIACQLAAIIGNNCKVVTGLYGSFYFKWYYPPESLQPWSFMSFITENYLRCVPEKARLVCGTDQIEELEEIHRERAVLWPIPIDTTVFEPASRKPKWGKIVSVGRMDVMKQYNLYMINVVKELKSKGYDVSWSVFGTGDHEPMVRQRIKEAGLEDVISMEGTVPYRHFWKVLSEAHVFVGMGTAILEAALFKVPNVYAIAYDRVGLTYGPLYRVPPGSIGPSLLRPPTLRVTTEIERILQLDASAYEAEERLNYEHALQNEMDGSMKTFVRMVEEAEPIKQNKARYISNYVRWSAARLMNGLKPERKVGHPEAPLYFRQN